MQDEEIPQFIYTDIVTEVVFPFLKDKVLWLIISNKRLLLLSVDKEQQIKLLWTYDSRQKEPLLVQRLNRVVADDCKIKGGLWQPGLQTECEPEFILKGRNIGSYESYFRVFLED